MAEPRPTSFDVRIWKVDKRPGKTGTRYRLRWKVAGRTHTSTFGTAALADSERSKLMTAARRGEAFDVETGLPTSVQIAMDDAEAVSWWEWSLTFVDIKWPTLAPTSRRAVAEALTTISMAIYPSDGAGRPGDRDLRAALFRWAFNTRARSAGDVPDEFYAAVRWLRSNAPSLRSLDDPAEIRRVLAAITLKIDGKQYAATTIARNRAVLHNIFDLATERGHFAANPLARVRWRSPKSTEAIDPRSVASPQQARLLLAKVREVKLRNELEPKNAKRYVAFFGTMYYAALRPSEAGALRIVDLELPFEGWGWLLISQSDAEISGSWSDDGQRTARQLKHRRVGEIRRAPCPPALTDLLHKHLEQFPPGPSGLLFRGVYGGGVVAQTYGKYFNAARKAALTPAEQASPLIRRPYDLRHSAVSTWLAAGVDSAQAAAWAGHSVAVLHRVYAHVLSGREDVARTRIDGILDEGSELRRQ